MARAALPILLVGTISFLGGCTSLLRRGEAIRPLPFESAVRVQSGRMLGSGALALANPRIGSFVLTAAHLLDRPSQVLVGCDPPDGGPAWHTGRVLRVDPKVDLALIWLPECVLSPPARLRWARSPPGQGDPVAVLVAAPERGSQVVTARVVERGCLESTRPFAQGMSGSGVFHNGFFAGLLYGHERDGGPAAARRGRFLPVASVRRFLGSGFRFLSEGGVPAEPR